MEIIAGILLFATIVSSMTYPAMFLVCSLSLISVAAYLSLKSFHASFVLGTPSPEFNFFADERRNSLVNSTLSDSISI